MAVVQKPETMNGDIQDYTPGPPRDDVNEAANLQDQIHNIQKVIRLTKENLEALNATFGKHQNPDPMYIQEYEALANKIHELQEKESHLMTCYEQILYNERESPTDATQEQEGPLKTPTPILLGSTQGNNLQTAGLAAQSSPKALRAGHVKAYLPDEQVTSARVEPGIILKEALKKAMSRRGLEAEKYEVYDNKTKMPISWDIDMANLGPGRELRVQLKRGQPSLFMHNIVRKTYFFLTFCDGCGKSLFQSLMCKTCNIKFHQRCINRVSFLCPWIDAIDIHKPLPTVDVENTYYIRNRNPAMSSNHRNKPTPPLGHRERSTSAPNVCLINVGDASVAEFGEVFDPQSIASSNKIQGFDRYVNPAIVAATEPIIRVNHSAHSPPNSTPDSPTNSGVHHQKSSSTDVDRRIRRHRRDSNEDWEIPAEDIQMGPRIGSGSFGTVYRGYYHGHVAIKRLNVTDPTPQQLKAFKNEVAVLRKTSHMNILLFSGWTSRPQLAIITQWCEGSSLYKHLHITENRFEMVTLMEISRQTAQGMDYLHAKSIIHRDLKTNNIFLTDNLTVKIGDFGLATVKTRWSGSHQFQQPTGSILWMAPEVIRMKEANPYTNQSDVYAYGIVLYELMTGQLPYSNINNKDQILFMVGKGYLKPDISKTRSDTPKRYRMLMQECCKFDREQRPLFPQILSVMESIVLSLRKLRRSASEPTLNQSQSEDLDLMYFCASPKTPINSQYPQFFFSTAHN
ncbi:serine/threonine-protein kinase B-raf-like isoform X1 [Mizuhopecten yessoensis]|uniref:serine/threonine-protein kinase B-raf-like isoform X1 n=1 Tax=Mizuhopecten yessoensis TaxID=6573 RepID=UPI000B457399|nr:serine/threonine-protein kinase B-raf-like isoform X1 [Mizuhopecten yessoensis]